MIKVGLVGEDPHDTSSIKNLLLKKYEGKINFYPLAKGIKGYQLDNAKTKKVLSIEFQERACKFILYIRDLDSFETEQSKITIRKKWFADLDGYINGEGILLINIWELEALIFADIETLNRYYRIERQFKNPMYIKEPKEELMRITRKTNKKYQESDCPEIFNKLNFETVLTNCSYFKTFIAEFDKKLATK